MIDDLCEHNAFLRLRDISGDSELPIRVITATARQYKIEILKSASKFSKGQVTTVPIADVSLLAHQSTS